MENIVNLFSKKGNGRGFLLNDTFMADCLETCKKGGYDFDRTDVYLSILAYYSLQVRQIPTTATEQQKPWTWILGMTDTMDMTAMYAPDVMQFFIPITLEKMVGNFTGCSKLIYIPDMPKMKPTTCAQLFYGCTSLLKAPAMNYTTSTSANEMFTECKALKGVGDLDMPMCTSADAMFSGCTSLKKVGTITFNATGENIFKNCSALEEFRLIGFKGSIDLRWSANLKRSTLVQFFKDLTPATEGTPEIALDMHVYNVLKPEDIAIATAKGYAVYGGVVPSPPTFSPSLYSFNDQFLLEQTITSSDGMLQTQNLEDAEIYVEGVKLNYGDNPVQVLGYYLAYESASNGIVTIVSFRSDTDIVPKPTTADLHITNIVFNGVAYSPANSRF